MNEYIAGLAEIALGDLFRKNEFVVGSARIETLARQVVGSLLWIGPSQFYIGFDLAVLGTTAKEVALSVEQAKLFFLRSNRVIRELKTRKATLWFRDIIRNPVRTSQTIRNELTLVLMTDA